MVMRTNKDTKAVTPRDQETKDRQQQKKAAQSASARSGDSQQPEPETAQVNHVAQTQPFTTTLGITALLLGLIWVLRQFDFALVLLIATLVTGGILLLNKYIFVPRQLSEKTASEQVQPVESIPAKGAGEVSSYLEELKSILSTNLLTVFTAIPLLIVLLIILNQAEFYTVFSIAFLVITVVWLSEIFFLAPRRALAQPGLAGTSTHFAAVLTWIVLLSLGWWMIRNFNLDTLLIVAALLLGWIWFLENLVPPLRESLHGREQAVIGQPSWPLDFSQVFAGIVDICRSFFPIILAVLIMRSFIVEPFRIPSGSMIPTLREGDFILVNKYYYGLRLPVLNIKILANHSPKRGDVVVFHYPLDPDIAYIKRVVGLPGDYLEYRDKQLYVNGQRTLQRTVSPGVTDVSNGYELHMETLDNQKPVEAIDHFIQIRKEQDNLPMGMSLSPNYKFDLAKGYKVPEGYYFMMGDNRDNSSDSRFWGPLPEQNIIGKAFSVVINLSRFWKPIQ
ncbi:MAG: signal peptidase I [Candidatus Competibacteraceae bacterium]